MDNLGNRMKSNYEEVTKIKLIRRMPVIIRLDGRAFHTLTRGCTKPFDVTLINAMRYTARYLCEEIQNCKCAYVQSDEISILMHDYDRLSTEAWFGNELQKIVSISAAMASAKFTTFWEKEAVFDSRAFNIPKEEVCNYFVWRQKDWIRNSIQMLGQANFSHKQLHGKGCSDIQDMLMKEKSINWSELSDPLKNGTLITKQTVNETEGWTESSPVFTKDRSVIENLLIAKEEE